MYFADSSHSSNLEIYKNLLDLYLDVKQEESVKELFVQVLVSTHKLVTEQINESSVDHRIYDLVIALSDKKSESNRNYFRDMDPEHIDISQFRSLQGILSSLVHSPSIH
jgi:hypothetical protein